MTNGRINRSREASEKEYNIEIEVVKLNGGIKMIFEYFDTLLGMIKLIILKFFYHKRLKFKGIEKVASGIKFCIKKSSSISMGKSCRIRSNTSFYCYDGGKIEIGNNTFINEGCIISSRKFIKIGSNCNLGNNISIYDNDHDYKNSLDKYVSSKIIIGNNVWIGANCIILRGVSIGDNCVIAAGSIVRNNVPENSILYQKRNTIIKEVKKND